MKRIDTQFYPGWTRKAITFSIDDGVVPNDRKLIEIVRPAGIRGSFNLCTHNMQYLSRSEYREFYQGYEIANHTKYHPYAFADGVTYQFAEELFDRQTADPAFVYPAQIPHLYYIMRPKGWRCIADTEGYIGFIEECHRELEQIFGPGSVRSFVWPFDQQENAAILKYLDTLGYYGVRRSGARGAQDNFTLEEDRMPWHYTVNHINLLEMAGQYERQQDDGKLKFFCFGVHSNDFEKDQKWDDLRQFAKQYGNRPQDYYYATVGEIFAYADALKLLIVTENSICNPSKTDVYLQVDGEKVMIRAGGEWQFPVGKIK